MLDAFMNKNYALVVLMVVSTFILLQLNLPNLQNKLYHKNGTACPDAAWTSLILLVVGTVMYLFINNYSCARM